MENGVTSEPVPEVVGIQTIVAFSPKGGNSKIRLRISIKRIAKSSNLSSGCSYINHKILAASIGEPPPKAIMASGWKVLTILIATLIVLKSGSGLTSEKIRY